MNHSIATELARAALAEFRCEVALDANTTCRAPAARRIGGRNYCAEHACPLVGRERFIDRCHNEDLSRSP